MNKEILDLITQGEHSRLAVLSAATTVDMLQRQLVAAQEAVAAAQARYDEIGLAVARTGALTCTAFGSLIQKRVDALAEIGLIDLDAVSSPAVQTAPTSEIAPTPSKSPSVPAPDNPYGEDTPRARSAYQKGYDDGISGQPADLTLYKRASMTEAYRQGHEAGARDFQAMASVDGASGQQSEVEPVNDTSSLQVIAESGPIDPAADTVTAGPPPAAEPSGDDDQTAPAGPNKALEALATNNAGSEAQVSDQNFGGSEFTTEAPVAFSPDGIFMRKARDEGAQAACEGVGPTANPYEPGPLYQAWLEGHQDAELNMKLEELTSPDSDMPVQEASPLTIIETAPATATAHSFEVDPSIFDEDTDLEVSAGDQVTIVSPASLDIPPFLRRDPDALTH